MTGPTLVDWIAAIGSIALLVVTGWYAYLTSRLARSAAASAQSAELVARLAQEALGLDYATLALRFRAELQTAGGLLGPRLENLDRVELRPLGATCTVVGIRVRRLAAMVGGTADWREDGFALEFVVPGPTAIDPGGSAQFVLAHDKAVLPRLRCDLAEIEVTCTVGGGRSPLFRTLTVGLN